MAYSPERAEIRFGCGLSPALAAAGSPDLMLAGLIAPDEMARRFPIKTFEQFLPTVISMLEQQRAARKTEKQSGDQTSMRAFRTARRMTMAEAGGWHARTLMRWTQTTTPLRERLALFWADHFTARGKNLLFQLAVPPYVEEAIRPNLTGRFTDLLIAAALHPMMAHYLDQQVSAGPNSVFARLRPQRGLNENLAREILELHTLGVGGPYGQRDVREMAELLTGVSFDKSGFRFRPGLAEPGAKTVLGRTYGGRRTGLDDIHRALDDLAMHPATARHLARKLAVHFVADTPPPQLVSDLERRYLEAGGDLMAVYEMLLTHADAQLPELVNVKPPFDFVASACRALDMAPGRLPETRPMQIRNITLLPLRRMGQPWHEPPGPDGWPEDDGNWITPQGLAARMDWAMAAPTRLRPDLPDPREFVTTALGPYATAPVLFAANAAETRAEGIGLILASPAFQRR